MNKDDYRIKASLILNKIRAQQREIRDVPCDTNHSISQNMREEEAILYLKEKRILDIVDFLMSDLLVHRPYDPFEYLTQLLDKCILSRDGLVDPPSSFFLYGYDKAS
ncbi:uncharacterized protein LOC126854758 [Cataglyphis hispanica]|uniref:uncharacterized protein LOC126854758 n=1 Tax=Cataglyphis hispanica TaxID=1086592 RepID=UPI0021800B29|nr:uncharacterized protein LOC126854758 [Cataglyphis hispanica]